MSTGKKLLIGGMAAGAALIVGYIVYQKYQKPATAAPGTPGATVMAPITSTSINPDPESLQKFLPTSVANVPMYTSTAPGAIAAPAPHVSIGSNGQVIFTRLSARQS